jgi:dipeptidase E
MAFEARVLLISSSNVYGYGYLDQPEPEIRRFLSGRKRILFVPYALLDCEGYTRTMAERLGRMGFEVASIGGGRGLGDADAIFVGGGNTWRLLRALYDRDLIGPIRDAVGNCLPYIGSSAGSNVAAPTIRTTNDMPIVEVPSMDALGLVTFQINPHYLDPDPKSTHMGETREERIAQFHEENEAPVVGLREGTMLRIEGRTTKLLGLRPARIFRRGQEPVEVEPDRNIDEYLR